jgi:hypothetical protein
LKALNARERLILGLHAFVGWALCGATMGIGLGFFSEQTALIAHAIGAPIFFGGVSWNYFTKFSYTTPIATALTFVGFVIFVDFFLVALVIERSFDMFRSPLGTWIPFMLLFLSTFTVGRYVAERIDRTKFSRPA